MKVLPTRASNGPLTALNAEDYPAYCTWVFLVQISSRAANLIRYVRPSMQRIVQVLVGICIFIFLVTTANASDWRPSNGDYSGITFVEGERRSGVGMTMLIEEIAPGSPADLAGLRVGDIFHNADAAYFDIKTARWELNMHLAQGKLLKLVVVEPRKRRVELRPAPKLPAAVKPEPEIETPKPSTDPELRARLTAYAASGSFAREESALSQFIDIAKALGIESQDITTAIESGHFVPSQKDLERVYLEPEGITCEQIIERYLVVMAERGQSQSDIDRQEQRMRQELDSQCNRWRRSIDFDPDRVNAWNQNFGVVQKKTLGRYGGMSAPDRYTIVGLVFRRSDRDEAYLQKRCDFTSQLADSIPNAKIDCRGLRPTSTNNALAAVLFSAQRDDSFGGPSDGPGFRLRLISEGEFEAFTKLHEDDLQGDVSGFTDGDPDVYRAEQAKINGRRFLAAYAIARGRYLGSCGDRMRDLPVRSAGSSQTRTVSGITIRRDDWDYTTNYEIPNQLWSLVRSASNIEIILEIASSRGMRRVFENLSCADQARTQLEDNIVRYR